MTEIHTNPIRDNIKRGEYIVELTPADDESSRIDGCRDPKTGEIFIGEMGVLAAIGIACHEVGHNASEAMFFVAGEKSLAEGQKQRFYPLNYEEAKSAVIELTREEKELLERSLAKKMSTDDAWWEHDEMKSIIVKLVGKYTQGTYVIRPDQINFVGDEEVEKKALGAYYQPIKEGLIRQAVIKYSREMRNGEAAAMQVEHGCMTILENTCKGIGVNYTYVTHPSSSPAHDRAAALVKRVWKCGGILPSQLDRSVRAEIDSGYIEC